MKLQNKIPLYVVIIILLVGLVGSVAIIVVQKQASTHQFEEAARALSASILNGLEQDMLNEDRSHVQQTLDDLNQNDSINEIDVISPDGSVWASTNNNAIDTAGSNSARDLLSGSSQQDLHSEFSSDHLTLVTPIEAKEQCLQCHGSIAAPPNAQNYLGAIGVDVSTEFLDESIARSEQILLLVGGLTFILVSGTLVLMLRRSVLRPLSRLTDASEQIIEGDYSTRVTVAAPDNEIGAVSVAFNEMLDEVERHTEQLKAANRELEQVSRMKSEFLANMSHELRTPLNVIIGFSEVLKDTPPPQLDDSDRKEFCENIVTSGYHLLELINDVLDLAKVEAGQMQIMLEEFHIGTALRDVITTMQPLAAKKKLDLDVSVSERLTSIYADVGKFKQIMYNLVGNAIKFTPEGGSVSVSAATMGTMARFSVADTGMGIAPEDRERIFSEFQQVDGSASRQFEGTGLGLALTRKFVEMQQGQIWVESNLGTGSTFFFTLPLSEAQSETTAAFDSDVTAEDSADSSGQPASAGVSASEPAPASGAGDEETGVDAPCILVVEDDEATADLIGVWLSHEGYAVVFAADGVEALEKARERRPLAVCLDIMLPKKDGWQVLHELKSDPELANVGVIVCSALDNPELGFALGAADYCMKPLSRKHLLDTLRNLQQAMPGKRSQPQVLIADSDPEAVNTTGDILKRQGFGVTQVHDGQLAINKALELSPDVVILDLMIPIVSCFDVISSLRRHPLTTDTPIIVTTTKHLREKEMEFLTRNVQKIVVKGGGGREQLMEEIFRLEKLQPRRALLIDGETNLFNRRYFRKRLAEEVSRAERYALDMSVILLEVDGGEADTGIRKEITSSIAGLLRSNFRAADPLARYDKNRFAVLLPETPKDAGHSVAGKVVKLVRKQEIFDKDGMRVNITMSAAVAASPNGTVSAEHLVSILEQALAKAGKAGGDMVQPAP